MCLNGVKASHFTSIKIRTTAPPQASWHSISFKLPEFQLNSWCCLRASLHLSIPLAKHMGPYSEKYFYYFPSFYMAGRSNHARFILNGTVTKSFVSRTFVLKKANSRQTLNEEAGCEYVPISLFSCMKESIHGEGNGCSLWRKLLLPNGRAVWSKVWHVAGDDEIGEIDEICKLPGSSES